MCLCNSFFFFSWGDVNILSTIVSHFPFVPYFLKYLLPLHAGVHVVDCHDCVRLRGHGVPHEDGRQRQGGPQLCRTLQVQI